MKNIAPSPLLNAVQQFNSDLINQIKSATFDNALLLPAYLKFFNEEKNEDGNYIVDSTAFAVKAATVVIDGIELLAAYGQEISFALIFSSTDSLNSIHLDELYFSDLSICRGWRILAKPVKHHSLAYNLPISNALQLNNQDWIQTTELHCNPSLDKQLEDLTAQIGFMSKEDVSALLEAQKQHIFESSASDLESIINDLD